MNIENFLSASVFINGRKTITKSLDRILAELECIDVDFNNGAKNLDIEENPNKMGRLGLVSL